MSIFTTIKERDRVFGIIEKRKMFDDLNETQQAAIHGMYWSIEELENMKGDFELEESTASETMKKIAIELMDTAIDKAIERLEVSIAEMYVSFSDDNAAKEWKDVAEKRAEAPKEA